MEKELSFYNNEFEDVVRDALSISDRPIYVSDVLNVSELNLSNFDFDIRDCETISQFKNLKRLVINIGFNDLSFLSCFSNLRELNIEFYKDVFDFKYISMLGKLEDVFVSGGDLSDMKIANLELIADIDSLESLSLHEFGYVDLRPLKKMQQLKIFMCAYADEIVNYDAIGELCNLEHLDLTDLQIGNMDFLKNYLLQCI